MIQEERQLALPKPEGILKSNDGLRFFSDSEKEEEAENPWEEWFEPLWEWGFGAGEEEE